MMSDVMSWANEAATVAAHIEHEWDEKNLEWPITEQDTVWEVGAFKGRWALQMCQRYNCHVICFEPQEWAAITCKYLLRGYDVEVIDAALGIMDGEVMMSGFGTDGCHVSSRGVPVRMVDVARFAAPSLALINIEGYDYGSVLSGWERK
jgi:FkbM family methyltransferase